MKTIKWVKFYYTNTGNVKTLFTDSGVFQDDGQTFQFADPKDMLEKSTEETGNFWNGIYVGRGFVKE